MQRISALGVTISTCYIYNKTLHLKFGNYHKGDGGKTERAIRLGFLLLDNVFYKIEMLLLWNFNNMIT